MFLRATMISVVMALFNGPCAATAQVLHSAQEKSSAALASNLQFSMS